MTPTNPMPVNPLATGVVDMSNGQVQFNKHLGQMGMGIGVHGMSGGKVTFGRSKYGRQWTGINSMHGGTANFNGWGGTSGSSSNPGPMTPTNPGPMNPTNPGPMNPTNPGPMNPTSPGPMTPTNTGPMTPTNTGPMTPTNT